MVTLYHTNYITDIQKNIMGIMRNSCLNILLQLSWAK